jgi:hypothetical protein
MEGSGKNMKTNARLSKRVMRASASGLPEVEKRPIHTVWVIQ